MLTAEKSELMARISFYWSKALKTLNVRFQLSLKLFFLSDSFTLAFLETVTIYAFHASRRIQVDEVRKLLKLITSNEANTHSPQNSSTSGICPLILIIRDLSSVVEYAFIHYSADYTLLHIFRELN